MRLAVDLVFPLMKERFVHQFQIFVFRVYLPFLRTSYSLFSKNDVSNHS